MATKVETAVVCPNCGNREEFMVRCAEWVYYEWDGTQRPGLEWERDRSCEDVHPINGLNYHVTCGACSHQWESEPWD